MNREILFRGKRADNGEWISGGTIITFIEKDVRNYYMYPIGMDVLTSHHPATGNILKMSGDCYKLIPETVGQYTGLTDKNGKKIFEGDIVKITDRNVCFDTMAVIEFGNPNGLYNWGWQLKPLENKPFAMEILHWVDMEESGAFIEVIGNIHDNPELLEEGKDG